jgi:hypothetical protein
MSLVEEGLALLKKRKYGDPNHIADTIAEIGNDVLGIIDAHTRLSGAQNKSRPDLELIATAMELATATESLGAAMETARQVGIDPFANDPVLRTKLEVVQKLARIADNEIGKVLAGGVQ